VPVSHRNKQFLCNFKSGNVLEKIVEEHRKVENLYKEFKQSSTDAERKQVLVWEIIRELSIHAAKEEMVIYPAVREKLGDAAADKALAEHLKLKEILSDLDSMKVGDEHFITKMISAMEEVSLHVKEEEINFFPNFLRAPGVTDDYLEDLYSKYNAAESIAPSRPHPLAPNRPPLNVAANTTAAPLDAARDAARFGLGGPPDKS
jgi:hemerythrin superfamily protein